MPSGKMQPDGSISGVGWHDNKSNTWSDIVKEAATKKVKKAASRAPVRIERLADGSHEALSIPEDGGKVVRNVYPPEAQLAVRSRGQLATAARRGSLSNKARPRSKRGTFTREANVSDYDEEQVIGVMTPRSYSAGSSSSGSSGLGALGALAGPEGAIIGELAGKAMEQQAHMVDTIIKAGQNPFAGFSHVVHKKRKKYESTTRYQMNITPFMVLAGAAALWLIGLKAEVKHVEDPDTKVKNPTLAITNRSAADTPTISLFPSIFAHGGGLGQGGLLGLGILG